MFNLLKRHPQRRRNVRRPNLVAVELLEMRLLKTDILPGQGDTGQTTAPQESTSSETGDSDKQSPLNSTPASNTGMDGGSYDASSAVSAFNRLTAPVFIYDPNDLGEGSDNYDPGLDRRYDDNSSGLNNAYINAIALENALDLMFPEETNASVALDENNARTVGWDVPIPLDSLDSDASR